MAAQPTTQTGEAGERTVAMFDLTTPAGFSAARADWKAAGCPADHPYLTTELPSSPIVPLVAGITTGMVATAAAMKAAGMFPERKVW